jgi:hypothetical protein
MPCWAALHRLLYGVALAERLQRRNAIQSHDTRMPTTSLTEFFRACWQDRLVVSDIVACESTM